MTPKETTSANGAASLPALYLIASLAAGRPAGACAADTALQQPEPAVASADPITEYFATWYDRVDAAQASQPHWMTPITTSPRALSKSIDMINFNNSCKTAGEINNFGGGKGLPPLPTGRLGLSPPPSRAASAGGDFDIQGTIGYTLPTDERNHVGTSLVTRTSLQYHIGEYFWPEFAFNDTQWTSGVRADRNQLFVSPGIMFGRFQIYNRVKFNFGIAYQVAYPITTYWIR